MELDYNAYHVFRCVAKCGNITAAAKELYLTQPTVSRTIQKLEEHLNSQLFIRTKQGVILTAEGEILLQHVDLACRHFELAEQKIRQRNLLGEGSLRIGVTEMTMQYFLLPFLEQFKKEYPNIHVQLSFEYPGTMPDQLHNGLLDMAVLTTPLQLDESLKSVVLSEYRDVLIAGPDYFYLAEQKQSLKNLEKEPFVLMEEGTSARNYLNELFDSYGVSIDAEYNVSSMPMIVPMVTRNLGIGFIPTVYVQREFFRGDVKRIYLEEELPKREICLVTSSRFPETAAMKEFIGRIVE